MRTHLRMRRIRLCHVVLMLCGAEGMGLTQLERNLYKEHYVDFYCQNTCTVRYRLHQANRCHRKTINNKVLHRFFFYFTFITLGLIELGRIMNGYDFEKFLHTH